MPRKTASEKWSEVLPPRNQGLLKEGSEPLLREGGAQARPRCLNTTWSLQPQLRQTSPGPEMETET